MKKWIFSFWTIFEISYRATLARKTAWLGTLVFSITLLILFPFSFGTEEIKISVVQVGCFWGINQFLVALTVSRIFSTEREAGFFELVLSSPIEKSALLVGKIAFNTFLLGSLQIPLFLMWLLLYNIPQFEILGYLQKFIPIAFAFNLGSSTLGTILSTIVERTYAKEILFPILFYPLQVPLLLSAVTLMIPDSSRSGLLNNSAWWTILLSHPVIFITIGVALGKDLLRE